MPREHDFKDALRREIYWRGAEFERKEAAKQLQREIMGTNHKLAVKELRHMYAYKQAMEARAFCSLVESLCNVQASLFKERNKSETRITGIFSSGMPGEDNG